VQVGTGGPRAGVVGLAYVLAGRYAAAGGYRRALAVAVNRGIAVVVFDDYGLASAVIVTRRNYPSGSERLQRCAGRNAEIDAVVIVVTEKIARTVVGCDAAARDRPAAEAGAGIAAARGASVTDAFR
jgi:hypothetical protein